MLRFGINGIEVKESGCVHHHTPLDIIGIKFKCCDRIYACYACHEALADHPAERWSKGEWEEKAILCRACGVEMAIKDYLSCHHKCPYCAAPFNSRCESHWHYYFSYEKP